MRRVNLKQKLEKVLELMIAEKPWKKLFKEYLKEHMEQYEIRTDNS